jgi:hypothetical protein
MTLGRRHFVVGCALSALASPLILAGCKDRAKESAEQATAHVAELVKLADKDVAEVERGLPEGAKKMATSLAKEPDPKANPAAVRSALLRMRQQVPDLGIAKSTFFAFTDDKGIAIRNDLEQDTMAGKDVIAAYPGLRPVLGGEAFIATTGQFGTPNPKGPDKEFAAGVPVKRDDGAVAGMLVTGWTYRRFAYHLQESLKRDVADAIMRAGDKGKLPVLYVFLFDKEHVYGARETPPINEQALKDLGVFDKTGQGPTGGVTDITERKYGWAAARVPKLGPEVGIAVLRSEI